uniref:Uncharacterized protein n=1 Tax=Physcomitrium patens TaxID=3218 RepID=A0A2K1K452_PHYPA|nr:hypothetical protein PHYPA_013026 [Physcomitrium patens]
MNVHCKEAEIENYTAIKFAMRIVARKRTNMGIHVDPPLLKKKNKILF